MHSQDSVRFLENKVAVVTGGAGGIGRATGEGLARAGAKVVLLDRDQKAAESAAASLGDAVYGAQVDVTDETSVASAFGRVASQFGKVDILINNAGIAIRRPTLELDLADWNKVIDVNLTGIFLCSKAAARHMAAQGSGTIVNVASIMGLSGGGFYPNISYQTSKGGVINMTRALAVEWAKQGIRVNAVAPTYVDTDLIGALKENPEFIANVQRTTPMGRLARPEEIADAIVFLSGPQSSMITGHTLPVDGGFLAQ